MARHLFTSESVSMGHPDKVADQISDSILDAIIEQDPDSRVACEVLVTTGLCVMAGEITTRAHVDYAQVARETIQRIGYTNDDWGINGKTCAEWNAIDNLQKPLEFHPNYMACLSQYGTSRGRIGQWNWVIDKPVPAGARR